MMSFLEHAVVNYGQNKTLRKQRGRCDLSAAKLIGVLKTYLGCTITFPFCSLRGQFLRV